MFEKIKALPVMAYLAFTGFIRDFKKDQRGLEVVQVVLIILVGVVLIGLLMYLLREQLQSWWNDITGVNVSSGTEGGFSGS